MTYRERATSVPGAVLWCSTQPNASEPTRILPDGCLDLLWDGSRLFVAGPDTAARRHQCPAGVTHVALRFSGGTGPALLGVPADELRDRSPDLADLWPTAQVRMLTDRVARDPVVALEEWAVERATTCETDPLGPRVLGMASAGTPVALMAERLGLSVRHLHRRCLPVFGYGPRRLARILRLGRALDQARAGTPLAQVAAGCGYADQAHVSCVVRALTATTPTGLLRELRGR
jgi:AraC-like DNA-binding protein